MRTSDRFENNQLLMIENYEGGIHYFTSFTKAAQFIGCTPAEIRLAALKAISHCHEWVACFVDGTDVCWQFINEKPNKNILR